MPAYEYKVLTSTEMEEEEESALNRLGAEGFELVSVTVSQVTYVESGDEEEEDEGDEYTEDVVTYYFKRQK